MKTNKRNLQGFTLIELSIVIAIIAMIAGGIVAGQSLLQAAQIRSVSTDVIKYRNAVESFKQQFNALPGDLKNAYAFFGSDCGADADAPAGCNGDGNGSIDGATEGFRAWQHLQLSGILSASFSGEVGTGCTPDVNVPGAGVGVNAGYGFARNSASTYIATRPSYLTLLVMGADNSSLCTSPAVTIDEAYEIDLKADDGNPFTGSTVAIGASCVSGSDFNFGQEGVVCAMGFTLN